MRTPTPMIVGIVLGPCGLVLNLTCMLAPSWRDVTGFLNKPVDLIQHQGIWDICNEQLSSQTTDCNIEDSLGYFTQQPVRVAKGLMPTSVIVIALGLVVTSLGVRCWQDLPHYLLAGLGGLVLFVSGLLSLIAVSWYNYEFYNLPHPSSTRLQVGYCLVLGYLGSCMEIIGGITLTFSFDQCCKECKLKKAAMNSRYAHSNQHGPSGVGATSTPISSKDLHMKSQNPRSYSNSLDVLEDEQTGSRSQSRLPCDTDV